jgi:hypothetical protein
VRVDPGPKEKMVENGVSPFFRAGDRERGQKDPTAEKWEKWCQFIFSSSLPEQGTKGRINFLSWTDFFSGSVDPNGPLHSKLV